MDWRWQAILLILLAFQSYHCPINFQKLVHLESSCDQAVQKDWKLGGSVQPCNTECGTPYCGTEEASGEVQGVCRVPRPQRNKTVQISYRCGGGLCLMDRVAWSNWPTRAVPWAGTLSPGRSSVIDLAAKLWYMWFAAFWTIRRMDLLKWPHVLPKSKLRSWAFGSDGGHRPCNLEGWLSDLLVAPLNPSLTCHGHVNDSEWSCWLQCKVVSFLLLQDFHIVLFMDGTLQEPRRRLDRQIVHELDAQGLAFKVHQFPRVICWRWRIVA